MFDAHCHLPNNKRKAIICTSKSEEYDQAILNEASIGLLPPFCEADKILFLGVLEQNPTLNIGEVGLDKRYPNMSEQIAFLKEALQIAKKSNRLVSLHLVQVTQTALTLIEEYAPLKLIWHGFCGSFETAKRFNQLGGLISLGHRSVKSKDFERLLTLDFLLESDLPQGEEQRTALKALYQESAKIKHITFEQLEAEIDYRWSIYKA